MNATDARQLPSEFLVTERYRIVFKMFIEPLRDATRAATVASRRYLAHVTTRVVWGEVVRGELVGFDSYAHAARMVKAMGGSPWPERSTGRSIRRAAHRGAVAWGIRWRIDADQPAGNRGRLGVPVMRMDTGTTYANIKAAAIAMVGQEDWRRAHEAIRRSTTFGRLAFGSVWQRDIRRAS